MGSSRGVIILTLTNICSKVLSLIYIPLITVVLGDFGYGVYAASYEVYVFVYMIAIAGISTAIPKLMAEYSASGHERDAVAAFKIGRNISLLMGVMITILLVLFAMPATKFINSSKSYLAILALCPSVFFTAIVSAYRSYFQGRTKLTPIGVSQFIEQVLNVIFSIILSYVLMNYGVEYGVAGGAFGTTVGAFGALVYLKIIYIKEIKKKRKSKRRKKSNNYIFKYIIRYSVPLILSTAFIYAGNNLVDVGLIKSGLIKSGLNDTLATILYGHFNKYKQIINTPMIIITSLSIYILPLISRENVSENKNGLRRSIRSLINLGFLIGLPAAIGMSILSTEIFMVIFGPNKLEAAPIMKYGSAVFIVLSIYHLTNTMMNSLGKIKEGVVTSFIGVIIKVLCDFIFIPMSFFNIYGAVLGLFLSNFVMVILNMNIIERYVKKRGILRTAWIKPTIGALIMGGVVFLLKISISKIFKLILGAYIGNLISLLIIVYLGALVYIKVMIYLKAIDDEFINTIPRKIRPFLGISNVAIKEY